jgi:nitrite reductase/ring-hydroxylating ferredoxin subunit
MKPSVLSPILACIPASPGVGKIAGKIVTCRGHGWKYDVTTWFVTSSPGHGFASFPVTVVDAKIMVDIGN